MSTYTFQPANHYTMCNAPAAEAKVLGLNVR